MNGQLRLDWPFINLVPCGYAVILADPPWKYQLYSEKGEGKSPQRHYPCMETAEIAALPVEQLAARDCWLVLWTTWPMLLDAIEVMKAWGFTYSTGAPWVKQSRAGRTWAFGGGYVLRSASEPYLIGRRGRPKVLNRSQRGLIVAPVREHSRKPDEMHHQIESHMPGPRCELFARQRRPGWDVWGNETDKFEEAA